VARKEVAVNTHDVLEAEYQAANMLGDWYLFCWERFHEVLDKIPRWRWKARRNVQRNIEQAMSLHMMNKEFCDRWWEKHKEEFKS